MNVYEAANFNSNMVRLKDKELATHAEQYEDFNSNMVRLKEHWQIF